MNKAFLQRGEEIAKQKEEELANRVVLTADSLRGLILMDGDPQFVKFITPFECGLILNLHFWSNKRMVRVICPKMYDKDAECSLCKETSTVIGRDGKPRTIPNKPRLVRCMIVWNYNYGPDGIERTSQKGNKYTVLPLQIADIPAGESESHWNILKKAAKNGSLEKYIFKLEQVADDGFQPPTVPVQEELEELISDFNIKPEVLERFAINDHIRKVLSDARLREWQPRIVDGVEVDHHDDPVFAEYRDKCHTALLASCAGVKWDVVGLENPANKKEEVKQPVTAGRKKDSAKDLNKKSDE